MTGKPLWSADDQPARLAELTSDKGGAEKDAPLRRDVRSLGKLLGRIISEQAGDQLLKLVENLRQLLIQHREDLGSGTANRIRPEALMEQAQEIVARMDVEVAYRVTKARRSRIRAMRWRLRSTVRRATSVGCAVNRQHQGAFHVAFSRHRCQAG